MDNNNQPILAPENYLANREVLLDMLVKLFPCDFSVKENGTEIWLFLNHGSQKALVLKTSGVWEYK